VQEDSLTPRERIEAKKAEAELRESSRRKEALWRSLFAHLCGAFYIMAELHLGYKVDFRDSK